jgi:uncharacterized tellurite resistance protein B-like protein
MVFIKKNSAIKIIYYLMSIDGEVSKEELDKFSEIGSELIGEKFDLVKNQIIDECVKYVEEYREEESYDILQEGVDEALSNRAEKLDDGITARHLLWNLITVSHSDGNHIKDEERLISHITRVLKVEKSIYLEMKQLISTAFAIQNELVLLENSNRPYGEIRPLVEEAEKRKNVIAEAGKALIEDELIYYDPVEDAKKENALLNTGKKVTDTVTSNAKEFGDKTQKTFKDATNFVSGKASEGANGIKSGAGKLFSRAKGLTQKNKSEEGGK